MPCQRRFAPASFRSAPTFHRVYIVQLIPSTILPSVSDSRVEDRRIITSWNSDFNGDSEILCIFGTVLAGTPPLQKLLHVCASVIWRPSLAAFFLRNSIFCRRYLCS